MMWFQKQLVALCAAATVAATAFAAPPAKDRIADRPNQVRGDEITPEQQKAVELGLAYLAKQQRADGGFGDAAQPNVAITALSGLAFMQNGNLPGRGRYGENVTRAVDFVLNSCQESGLIAADQMQGPMYGHGFAALFLGEVYGMTGDERVKEKLQRAIRLIQKTQNREGGWRYQPAPLDADISVTICQIMALRAARDAGIKVEKTTIDNAVKYVRMCQNPDGGFSYMARQAGAGNSGFARSAAGVSSLYYAGIFEGDEITKGLKYMMNFLPARGGGGGGVGGPEIDGHYWYGHYYAMQAMFLAGGDWWAKWYPAVRDQIIAKQNKTTGAWSGDFTDEYATAMALIILQMPNRYLPVYTGKGPGS